MAISVTAFPMSNRVWVMDSLLDKVAGQASYEAKKARDPFALSIKMLGDGCLGVRRVCFKIIAVLNGLG